eukprot:4273312-Amphidinium_carterae.3
MPLTPSLGIYAWRSGIGIAAIATAEKTIATSIRAGPRDWIPTGVLQHMDVVGWKSALPPMGALVIVLQALCATQHHQVLGNARHMLLTSDGYHQHAELSLSRLHNEPALGASAVDLNLHSDRSSLCARRADHATMQTYGERRDSWACWRYYSEMSRADRRAWSKAAVPVIDCQCDGAYTK